MQITSASEASTDERASPFHQPVEQEEDDFTFASSTEEEAYWAGVADGIRNAGGTPPPRLAARARDDYPELVATAAELAGRPPDLLDFAPISLRHRVDGWTPEKQREYIEALADSGVSRYAAARVGMSEHSASRLRRRDDARSFNRACEAAMRMGARRLVSVAFERAIEGSIKRHIYHGEVVSEERVYDNRLLMALIGKLDGLFDPPEEGREIEQDWQPWMEAIEQGTPAPDADDAFDSEPAECPGDQDRDYQYDGDEVWQEGDQWWTRFPPPLGFAGEEEGDFEYPGYRRTLTQDEQAVIDADETAEREATLAEQIRRRDHYFGFAPENPDADPPSQSPLLRHSRESGNLPNLDDAATPPEKPPSEPANSPPSFPSLEV